MIGYPQKSARVARRDLADAHSSNGTFVRGDRLKPDDNFALGDDEPMVLGSVSVRFLTAEGFYRYIDSMR